MAKKKFYVVWTGRKPGIYETWEECHTQIFEFPKAKYKSFTTRETAEQAFKESSKEFIGKGNLKPNITKEQSILAGNPIEDSISVDGAWNTKTGIVEYQGVHTKTKKLLFKSKPLEDGTNNIVEFLAIVHGLAYSKQEQLDLPIYSDSSVAIGWVKGKKAHTEHKKSEKNIKLFNMVERAEKWLNENEYKNKIYKWETKAWGENPADFGRK